MYSGKSDIKSAFCVVPLLRKCWSWLVMKATNPLNNKVQYFVDKCLPFGESINCSHFQRISNALKHITEVKTGADITNYLDDFLFLALTIACCNFLLNQLLAICSQIGFPIALEKTEWASQVTVFLGILLDGKNYTLSIPLEKRQKAE